MGIGGSLEGQSGSAVTYLVVPWLAFIFVWGSFRDASFVFNSVMSCLFYKLSLGCVFPTKNDYAVAIML